MSHNSQTGDDARPDDSETDSAENSLHIDVSVPDVADVVADFDVDTKTLKRATWERWEFSVVDVYTVRVTNTSYAPDERDDHAYDVTVVRTPNDELRPADCACPADTYNKSDCKHKVACVLHGGPNLLQAAADYEPVDYSTDGGSRVETNTLADLLRERGGDDE